jgi:hypothetical protein
MACSVASDILGKHYFEIMIVWVFWAWAYVTGYICGGTHVGACPNPNTSIQDTLLNYQVPHSYCTLPWQAVCYWDVVYLQVKCGIVALF